MTIERIGLLALWIGALAGCKKPPPEALRVVDVQAGLSKAGLKLGAFQPTDAARFSAQKCEAGTVEALETVVCEYGSDEAVREGKRGGEGWIAAAVTGVALENGRTLLVLADRGRADPNGKLIHRITQAYRALK